MNLTEIKKTPTGRKRTKRIGRGSGSGLGKTAGKGHKGQNSRSGSIASRVFEGGTMPLYRRIPKRGFNNARFQDFWIHINVKDLNKFSSGDTVTVEKLVKMNLLPGYKSRSNPKIKLLGNGDLTVDKLKIKVHAASKAAQEKVEKAKGSVDVIRSGEKKTRGKK